MSEMIVHNPNNLPVIPIADLLPSQGELKDLSETNYKKLKNVIERRGFSYPVYVWEDKDGLLHLLDGHQRQRVLTTEGWNEPIPYLKVPANDLQEAMARLLEITSQYATITQEGIDEFIATYELNDAEVYEATSFDALAFGQTEEEPEVEEDEPPEVSSEPPVSKLGEVYQLGRHKVFCGDSTLRTSYEKLMGGKNADLVFTDPPYGMKKENEGVLNDNLNYDDLLEFNKQWIPLSFDFMKENGSWYCWGIDEPLMDIYSQIIKPMARKQQVTFRNLITWDKFYNQKPTAIEQQRSYVVYDEKCLFVMGGVQGFNNNSDNYYEGWEPLRLYLNSEMEKVGGRKSWKEALGNGMGSHYFTKSQWSLPTEEAYMKLQSFANGAAFKREYSAFKREYSALKREYDRIKSEWMATRAYFDNTHETYMTEVWRFETADMEEREGTGEHATPKPLALCARAIKSSSRENETVLDLFLGSGSTLIACEQTDRTCFGMELDPSYVDVIRKRYTKVMNNNELPNNWEELTPKITG